MRKEYTRVQYNEEGQKQCTNCREYKETSDFHKYSKAQDKLKPWCRVCVKAYDIKENDPKRIFPRKLDENGKVHCRNCGEYFSEEKMHSGMSYCIDCSPLLSRVRTLKNYNLTLDDYHKLLEEQNYSCKICNLRDTSYRKRLSVDHDHSCCPGEGSCGKCIRGLLCHHCNSGLGNAKDSIEILQKMIDYLKK
jgi:hypothetical protein